MWLAVRFDFRRTASGQERACGVASASLFPIHREWR
jgi:hypothetical protein